MIFPIQSRYLYKILTMTINMVPTALLNKGMEKSRETSIQNNTGLNCITPFPNEVDISMII